MRLERRALDRRWPRRLMVLRIRDRRRDRRRGERRSRAGCRGGTNRQGRLQVFAAGEVRRGLRARNEAACAVRSDRAEVREGADGSAVRLLGDFSFRCELLRRRLALARDELVEPAFEGRPERIDRRARHLAREPRPRLLLSRCGAKSLSQGLDLRDEARVVERRRLGRQFERIDDRFRIPGSG